jgi:SAM-dependent methyltransferase
MTPAALDVPPLDPRAYALLAEEGFGEDLFNPRQHVACELVERYATERATELCRRLALDALLATPQTVETIRRQRGWEPRVTPALAWLLARLADTGRLTRSDATYHLQAPLPAPAHEVLRERALAIDASYAPAYDLLDETAAAFPAIARGETTGERALLGKLALWIRYFDNRNGYYALNNRVTARAVAARLGAGAHVLEVGAGLGSATEALCEELSAGAALDRIARYRATEPVPFFSRRAERVLSGLYPVLPLTVASLDVNVPWAEQGVAPGSQQLVWGVNVFHLSRDLDAVLQQARTALVPGGWLVVGEGMRPAAERVVGAEFPFRLLESFTDVRLDPATRPTPGFLTAEHWLGALSRAGFEDVAVEPDVVRLRAYYPGMLAAAVCGRRHATDSRSAMPAMPRVSR